MKITVTETMIEADANELRASRTLADSINMALSNIFSRAYCPDTEECSDDEEETNAT